MLARLTEDECPPADAWTNEGRIQRSYNVGVAMGCDIGGDAFLEATSRTAPFCCRCRTREVLEINNSTPAATRLPRGSRTTDIVEQTRLAT